MGHRQWQQNAQGQHVINAPVIVNGLAQFQKGRWTFPPSLTAPGTIASPGTVPVTVRPFNSGAELCWLRRVIFEPVQ